MISRVLPTIALIVNPACNPFSVVIMFVVSSHYQKAIDKALLIGHPHSQQHSVQRQIHDESLYHLSRIDPNIEGLKQIDSLHEPDSIWHSIQMHDDLQTVKRLELVQISIRLLERKSCHFLECHNSSRKSPFIQSTKSIV